MTLVLENEMPDVPPVVTISKLGMGQQLTIDTDDEHVWQIRIIEPRERSVVVESTDPWVKKRGKVFGIMVNKTLMKLDRLYIQAVEKELVSGCIKTLRVEGADWYFDVLV